MSRIELKGSKRQQIQVNHILNLRYEFKYPMAANITKYVDILLYTFNVQAVNHLSPYAHGSDYPLFRSIYFHYVFNLFRLCISFISTMHLIYFDKAFNLFRLCI